MAKMVLKWAGIALAVLMALVGAYAAYVMLSYYRLDDNLPLEEGQRITSYVLPDAIDLTASPELTAVTANLGFGAYGPDFDFFMDGGTTSTARRKPSPPSAPTSSCYKRWTSTARAATMWTSGACFKLASWATNRPSPRTTTRRSWRGRRTRPTARTRRGSSPSPITR